MLTEMNRIVSERIFDLTDQKNKLIEKFANTPETDIFSRSILNRKIEEIEELLKINKEWFIYNQGHIQ